MELPKLIWRHLNETEIWKFDFGMSVRDKWPLASALVSELLTRARATLVALTNSRSFPIHEGELLIVLPSAHAVWDGWMEREPSPMTATVSTTC